MPLFQHILRLTLPAVRRRPPTRRQWPYQMPVRRTDERDIVQARLALQEGTPDYERYYQDHPTLRAVDERIRSAPGVHHPATRFFDSFQVAADKAAFGACYALQEHVDGPVAKHTEPVEAAALSEFVRGWAVHMGAHRVGITKLHDYQLYSHVGYAYAGGKPLPWGQPIENAHQFAVVFTVEMDESMVDTAPAGPASAEAARKYFDSSAIAIQLAAALRGLGHPARAHIVGNCQVQFVTLAKEAGLGEIGRMGLLLDPDAGPRVRIAAVTTDAPLVPNEPAHDEAVLDFCDRCTKCAQGCPARAIPDGPAKRQPDDGLLRWRIDAEACSAYWHTSGTYCGRCLAVCPLGRVASWLHPALPDWLRRNGWYQRLILRLDDRRHGRRPKRGKIPAWFRHGGADK